MGILVVLILLVGTIVSLSVGIVAYLDGSYAREKEVRWSTLYGDNCYDNRYAAPFSFFYDIGYASFDRRTLRAKRNKEMFKRK